MKAPQRLDRNVDFDKKVNFFSWVIYIFLFLLLSRVFFLQIIKGDHYYKQAMNNQEQYIPIPAFRGEIFDRTYDPTRRTNVILAENGNSMDLYIIPARLSQTELHRTITNLSIILDTPFSNLNLMVSNNIEKSIYSRYKPILLASGISKKILLRVAEQNNILPGVYWQNNPYRIYPYGKLGAHILGYVGAINTRELQLYQDDPEYNQESIIGKYGLEKYYDSILRGEQGKILRIVDAHGRIKDTIEVKKPIPGKRLILSIDARMQKIVEQALEGEIGAAIVSDPATGEILAMASSPTFDPNIFIGKIDEKNYYRLANDRNFPFLNRAISAKYPPSSTFKIITMTASLEEEISDRNTRFQCKGFFKFENDDRIFRCWAIHGWTDTEKSLAVSCDIYYYNVGYLLGSERIAQYARNFGLGSLSGIDLPGESPGFIPTHAWKRRIFHEAWYDGDTVNMSIGQGFMLATPLQMLNTINAVANGGVIYQPMIVKKILYSHNNQPAQIFTPKIIRNISLSRKNLEIIRSGLRKVMAWGTARITGKYSRVPMIGKTGTAQIYKKTPHAWFIGHTVAKEDEPVYSICVFVEHGGGGSDAAAPLAGAIIQSIVYDQDVKELKAFFRSKIEENFQNMLLRRRQEQGGGDENRDKHQDIQF